MILKSLSNRVCTRNLTLLLACQFACAPAKAEVIYIVDTGFSVENRVRIHQPAERVWQALIQQVDQWWPKDHSWWEGTFTIDPHAGGCFCERKGGQSALHMMITLVDPGQLMRMTGGLGPLQGLGLSGVLDWQLSPDENNSQVTQVTLTYRVNGYLPGGLAGLAPVVDQVQALQLGGLLNFLSEAQ